MHTVVPPRIAIVNEDTLSAIGLACIIRQMMPGIEINLFPHTAGLISSGGDYHHYFVSTRALAESASFYITHSRHTIVLTHGSDTPSVPSSFHTLNVCQDEGLLTRSILRLAEHSHATRGVHPLPHPSAGAGSTCPTLLTPRETQVLRGIVMGRLNKEIADTLGVTTATIISHRKNITEKLHQKSVSGLTIYAVMHGIVRAEEI